MTTTIDAQTVNWILTAIAIVLTAGRLTIRYSNARRFYGDDAVHLFALIQLIIHGATNQVTLAAKAQQKLDTAPGSTASIEMLLAQYRHLHNLNTVNNVFLYAIMWTVKIAFLLCYRQVFNCHKAFIRAWWFVLAFCILSYIPPFVGVVYTCHGADTINEYMACNTASSFRNAKLIFTCVLNVVSDLMVMALPLWMLSKLQVNIRQKIGLGFVFSIATFCVALDILRTIEAVSQNQDLYTVLEVNFTVIVFCLPTYRRIFASKKLLESWNSRSGSGSDSNPRLSEGRRWSGSTKQDRSSSLASHGSITQFEYEMQDNPSKKAYYFLTRQASSITDVESQHNEKTNLTGGTEGRFTELLDS